MMKRLNRLRKLWRLSSKDERKLALMLEMPPEVERAIPDAADTDVMPVETPDPPGHNGEVSDTDDSP